MTGKNKSTQLLERVKKVKGFVPIWKEKHVDCVNIGDWVKLHLQFDLNANLRANGIAWKYCALLPWTFSGVTIACIGGTFVNRVKGFKFLRSQYYTTFKMGESTTSGENMCGKVVQVAPYTHVTESLVAEKLTNYTGKSIILEQTGRLFNPNYKPVLITAPWYWQAEGRVTDDLDGDSHEKPFTDERFCDDFSPVGPEIRSQHNPNRCATVESMKLVKFYPPYFDVIINAPCTFRIVSLSKLLGQDISCPIHVTDCCRQKLEFITKDHCIQTHMMMMSDMVKASRRVSGRLFKIVDQFNDGENFTRVRRVQF